MKHKSMRGFSDIVCSPTGSEVLVGDGVLLLVVGSHGGAGLGGVDIQVSSHSLLHSFIHSYSFIHIHSFEQ
jgi:hypothetical protein